MSEHALDAAYERYKEGKIQRRDMIGQIIDAVKAIEARLDAVEVERSPDDEVRRILPSLLPLLPFGPASYERLQTKRGPGRPRKDSMESSL